MKRSRLWLAEAALLAVSASLAACAAPVPDPVAASAYPAYYGAPANYAYYPSYGYPVYDDRWPAYPSYYYGPPAYYYPPPFFFSGSVFLHSRSGGHFHGGHHH